MSEGAASGPAASDPRIAERLDLIDAAIYADLFDCAVTAEEMWRYSRARVDRERLLEMLTGDPALRDAISERRGLYCIRGREQLLDSRPGRLRRARAMQRRARAVSLALSRIPFVHGLLLTGSVGADDARESADLDLLVIVEPGRLATVFTLLGSSSRLLGRRMFCPNHYLSSEALTLDDRRDIYVAHELAQAQALRGMAADLRGANDWVAELLPNSRASEGPAGSDGAARRSLLQRLLERPLRGRLGAALEQRLQRLARRRLAHHYGAHGAPVPEAVLRDLAEGIQLRFHGATDAEHLLARYERRRSEVAALLA